ncbi:DEAD/DEAH box helicase, partial [Hydrogenivirga sp. 128-5-R1-1]|uniref:SNF2-related protein n=1 Tax=Hydrogenivirga sp. 128-5-R1-1 TaxID=392423 RepID=UPI0005166A1C
ISRKINTSNESEWLKNVIINISTVSIKDKKHEDIKKQLIFRIIPRYNFHHDFIPAKAKLKPDNSIEKSQVLSLNNLIINPNRDYVSQTDKEIISLLESISFFGNIRKEHIVYNVILERLIQQKKLYFNNHIYPIKELKNKKIKVYWENVGEKNKLNININIKNIIVAHDIYEYSPDENVFYKIEPQVNKYILKLLSNSVPLDKEKASKLYFTLKDAGFDVEQLPFVEEIEIEDTPVPVLKINYNRANGIVAVEFKIKYKNYYFNPLNEEKSIIYENTKKITIKRNLKKEREYKERINKTSLKNDFFAGSKYIFNLNNINIENFYKFVSEDIIQLKNEGWEIQQTEELPTIEDTEIRTDIEEKDNWWFDVSLKVRFEDKEVNLLPILKNILQNYDIKKLPQTIFVKYDENKILKIKKNDIKPLINTILNLYNKENEDNLKISRADLHLIDDELIINKNIKNIKKKLTNFKSIKRISQPKELNAKLRKYQVEGISWINFLYEYGFNGILADDMGLGKTVQVLAFLQYLKENKKLDKHSLIVVPTTLISNWEKEIERFTPTLRY